MSGLLNRRTNKSLPLRSSSIFTEIKGFTSRTTAILTYYNDHRREIEGLFVLPLDHASAIVEFESIIEGHYIFTEVKHTSEVNEKKVIYENEDLIEGVFNVSIGKIPPWILVEIQVTIIGEVNVAFHGDALRYVLPQTFSPELTTHLEDFTEVNTYTAVSTLAYSFQLEILIEAPCLLCGVQSNTHPIQVDAPPLSETGAKLRVTLPDEYEPTSLVFELLMFLCRPREPYILIEEPKDTRKTLDKNPISNIMQSPILMLSYSPDISTFQKELQDNSAYQVGEFLLMVDFSAVQNSAVHKQARESCLLFLKSLPSNCFFNFTHISKICDNAFTTSQPYSRQNLERAAKMVKNLKDTGEGVSLKDAFKWLYKQERIQHSPRQVFLLTCGDIKRSENLLELARKKHHNARLFTFGIGKKANFRLLECISSATKGRCFKIKENEKPHKQMILCLKEALQPAITDLKVSWILPDAYDVIYTPENLPTLFLGDRMNLYAILAGKEQESVDKPHDSLSSVKEFWFEDFNPFDNYTSEKPSNHDLICEGTSNETESPVINEEKTSKARKNEEKKMEDNDVFLTEEEADQLKHNIGCQKRTSLERIQTWRVSKFPDNDMSLDIGDDLDYISDTERVYFQHLQNTRRKKSNPDGNESIGSSNSYGSNRSSNSYFLAFPGYPTRMSSCRSAEDRSPRMTKNNSSDDQSFFAFADTSKELPQSLDKLHTASDNKKAETKAKGTAPRRKMTQTLIDEYANTHLIDSSNEDIIERILVSAVSEKRNRLHQWLNVHEEMTQCTWPLLDYDRKDIPEKSERRDSGLEHRDSGFGHRSSSEPRTSDLEEDIAGGPRKSGHFSKSSSGYFEENDAGSGNIKNDVIHENDTRRLRPTRCCSTLSVDGFETSEKEFKEQEAIKKKSLGEIPTTRRSTNKIDNVTKEKSHKKRIKPKQVWNTLLDKVKTITTAVSDRSGDIRFKIKKDSKATHDFVSFKEHDGIQVEHSLLTDEHRQCKANDTPTFTELSHTIVTEELFRCRISTENHTNKTVETDSENIHVKKKEKTRTRHRSIENRPLIEQSRTISTSSMFEIGQSEIGDIDNLHLLPSHALIYLSGQFGQRSFKRIIPFQLEFQGTKDTMPNGITVHQLAAKSIIRDLELQLDQDEMLLLNSGQSYVKNLIRDVSKSSHIVSKYTAIVTLDDKTKETECISILKHSEITKSTSLRLDNQPFVMKDQQTKASEKITLEQAEPRYEIKREKSKNDSTIWHTKLTLKSPTYIRSPNRNLQHTQHEPYAVSCYMKIVELMTSDGFWELSHLFAEALTLNFSQLRESCPFADPVLKNSNNKNYSGSLQYSTCDFFEHVWATTVALAWLHACCLDYHDEWCLIDTKANYWLKRQKLPKGFTLDDVFLLAQQTLKILEGNSRKSSVTNLLCR